MKNKIYYKEDGELQWSYTERGLISRLYAKQKFSSVTRGHKPPNYTLEEFSDWCFSQPNWDTIYEGYLLSEFDVWLKPSGDRLDNNLGYSLDNLRLVTWRENLDAYVDEIRKPILQFDMNGNLLNEFSCAREIYRKLGYSYKIISKACVGTSISCNNYFWLFKEEYEKDNSILENRIKRKKYGKLEYKIIVFSLEGNLVGKYYNIKHAKNELHLKTSPSSINACLVNRQLTSGNYIWFYINEYKSNKDILTDRLERIHK